MLIFTNFVNAPSDIEKLIKSGGIIVNGLSFLKIIDLKF